MRLAQAGQAAGERTREVLWTRATQLNDLVCPRDAKGREARSRRDPRYGAYAGGPVKMLPNGSYGRSQDERTSEDLQQIRAFADG
jgi:hypothetical protein